jgi:hypothetical protein
MRTIHILAILVLLAVAVPAATAHAGGVVTVCDEAHLLAALAGGGTVTFTCSGVITLTNTITIAADTTIDGSGQSVTISGNDAVRVFAVDSGITLILSAITVANGSAIAYDGGGGGIRNVGGTVIVEECTFASNTSNAGGGITSSGGAVIVSSSIFSDNAAYDVGGGIYTYGGAITISNSTFAGNDAGAGGALYIFDSTVIVSNSTFTGNSGGNGGAIMSFGLAGNLTVINSTLADNSAANGGGGAINTVSAFTLKNTIVANSLAGGNCAGAITDGGGNLSFPDTTCPGINADPMLGPLQNNGGPTWTMALGEGSAALDAGNDAICAAPPVNNLDQRGVTRPQGLHCDIGAVEQIIEPAAVSLSTINAESASGAIPPIIVFGLLLVALASFGAYRRVRQMRCD